MQRNTILALCGVLLILAFGMQRMTVQLSSSVPKVSQTVLKDMKSQLVQHFGARAVKVRTPQKTVVVQLEEPQAVPSPADLDWFKSWLLQKQELQSYEKFELHYDFGGNKGNLSGTLRP